MIFKFTGSIHLRSFAFTLLLMAASGALPSQVAAQEATESGKGNTSEALQQQHQQESSDDSASQKENDEQVTDAERLKRLEQTIELDKQKLAETRKQLAEQKTVFDQISAKVEKGESEIADKKKQLEKLSGAGASDEAVALAKEIEGLEERVAVGKSELDLRFDAGKMLGNQVRNLEQKIANEQQALEKLVNGPAPLSEKPTAQGPTAPVQGAQTPVGPSPSQLIAPGVTTTPTEANQPPQATEPETAEQIEARKEAEKREAEAKLAEQELESFVERKQALDRQIEIEKTLLQTAIESRQNIDAALDQARADTAKLIEKGAGKNELREVQGRISYAEEMRQKNQAEIDQRREELDTLYKQREELSEEQLAVTQQVEAKRKEAGIAKKRTVWLASPLHPRNVARWAVERGPRILLVIVVAWLLLLLVRYSTRRIARTLVSNVGAERARGTNRADTLALSFQSAASLLIVVAATLLAFQEAGVDIKTVLGGAAILGVAFAFGAQNLMRDYFTGFMIVLEDQYELGDLITVGSITGRVEKVNMRTTVLRDLEGRVHFIPNGEIKSVTNRTYVWGRAVLEIPVSFKEDVDRVMRVILEVEEEFRNDLEFAGWVIEDPVMMGLDRFNEYGMIIKTYVQTQPDKIFQTRRELLRRIKKRFDEEGIEISVPQRILLQSNDEQQIART